MTLKQMLIGVALVILAGVWYVVENPMLIHCGGRASNERNASGSLKTLGTAQADFRSNDRDGNGYHDFWVGDVQGLYALLGQDKNPIKLIEVTIARADRYPLPGMEYTHVPNAGPKAGYWYAVIPLDPQRKPYEKDHNDDGIPRHNPEHFAFCAWPDKQEEDSRLTFILNEENVMWKKDNGGKPVLKWPANPAAEGWERMDR